MSKTYTIPCRECGALWAEMCFCAKSDALWKAHKERECAAKEEVPPPTPVVAPAPMAMVPVPAVPVPAVPVATSIYAPEAAKYAQLTKEDPTNPLFAHLAEWYEIGRAHV